MTASTVQITVKGLVSPSLSACVGDLDLGIVPRHTVIVTSSGQPSDLVPLLEALDRRGILVDRVTESG